MSRRAFIGISGGEFRLGISPPGVDAKTAAANQLVLSISEHISQFIMIGLTGASTTVVPLGLSRIPMVVLLARQTISSSVPGYPSNVPIRPSPWHQNLFPVYSTATVNGNGASMTVSGAVAKVHLVYRIPVA